MLRKMPWEADQLLSQGDELLHYQRSRVYAELIETLLTNAAAVEPLLPLGDGVDHFQLEAQGLAHITNGGSGR